MKYLPEDFELDKELAGLRGYELEAMDYEIGEWIDIVHTAKREYVKKD